MMVVQRLVRAAQVSETAQVVKEGTEGVGLGSSSSCISLRMVQHLQDWNWQQRKLQLLQVTPRGHLQQRQGTQQQQRLLHLQQQQQQELQLQHLLLKLLKTLLSA
jgi:hypothetical protein